MFKTFKAKIAGIIVINNGETNSVDHDMTFTRSKILLKEMQLGKIFFDLSTGDSVGHEINYEFSKEYNKNDEKVIMIRTYQGKYKRGLSISRWNRFKANVIHHRYFIDREKEWFLKTLISATVGFLFGLIGLYIGYRFGIQTKVKESPTLIQSTTPK